MIIEKIIINEKLINMRLKYVLDVKTKSFEISYFTNNKISSFLKKRKFINSIKNIDEVENCDLLKNVDKKYYDNINRDLIVVETIKLNGDIEFVNNYKFNKSERVEIINLVNEVLYKPKKNVGRDYEKHIINSGDVVDNIGELNFNCKKQCYCKIIIHTYDKIDKKMKIEHLYLPFKYEVEFYKSYKGLIFTREECGEFIEKHNIVDYKIIHHKTVEWWV